MPVRAVHVGPLSQERHALRALQGRSQHLRRISASIHRLRSCSMCQERAHKLHVAISCGKVQGRRALDARADHSRAALGLVDVGAEAHQQVGRGNITHARSHMQWGNAMDGRVRRLPILERIEYQRQVAGACSPMETQARHERRLRRWIRAGGTCPDRQRRRRDIRPGAARAGPAARHRRRRRNGRRGGGVAVEERARCVAQRKSHACCTAEGQGELRN